MAKESKKKAGDLVSEWMEDFGRENGYELSRTELVNEGGRRCLRVYVDKLEDGGYGVMGTDDCEFISKYLSDKLDEADPIKGNYFLEVSSPGLDRPLLSPKDFERFMGSPIEIRLYESLNGAKMLGGKLTAHTPDTVTISDEKGTELTISKEKAAKINLAVIFRGGE